MKVVLDTNSLIHYFTNDLPDKAEKVKKILENEKQVSIPDVVFPELEYILVGKYKIPRDEFIDILHFLLSLTNVKLPQHITQAVRLFESTKLDLADSMIAAQSVKGKLASFDKELLRVEMVKPFWK